MRTTNKKGVELSMNLIIIAVMALIVLVIVILLVTGVIGNANGGISDCAKQQGGIPMDSTAFNANGCGLGRMHYPLGDKGSSICCVPSPIG